MSEIQNGLFGDKFRSVATMALLVLLVILIIITWLFPKQSSVSDETLVTLRNVATQIERVGSNIQRISEVQEKRNTLLEEDLSLRKKQRDGDYDGLLNKYGTFNPNDLSTTTKLDTALSVNSQRVQQPTVDERSGHLSAGASRTGKDK